MRRLKRAFSKIDDIQPGLADELGRFDAKLADYLEDAVRAAENGDDILNVARRQNIAVNLETLLRRTAEAMGFDVERMTRYVDEEIHETVRRTLEALPARPSEEQIRGGFRQIEDFVQQYLDGMIEGHLPQMLAEAQARTATEGPNAVLGLLGEVSEATYSRHAANMRYWDTAVDGVLRIEDPVLQNRSWAAIKETARLAWNRHWNWAEAIQRGIEQGLRERGVNIPDSFVDAFTRLRQGSQSFIKRRDTLWDNYFTAILEGRYEDPLQALEGAAEIYERLDREYAQLIEFGDAARRQMDAVFTLVMPQDAAPQLQLGVRSWRELIRRNARMDMERVAEFHRSIRGLPREQKHARWREFDEARMLDHQRILELEQLGRRMVNGDAGSLDFFVNQAEGLGLRPQVEEVANSIFNFRRAAARVEVPDLDLLERAVGTRLGPEDEAAVDRLVRRFLDESELAQLDEAFERSRVGAVAAQPPQPGPSGRRLIEGYWWRPAGEGEVFEPGREFRLSMAPTEAAPVAGRIRGESVEGPFDFTVEEARRRLATLEESIRMTGGEEGVDELALAEDEASAIRRALAAAGPGEVPTARPGEPLPLGTIITTRGLEAEALGGVRAEFRLPPGTRLRLEKLPEPGRIPMATFVPVDEAGNAIRVRTLDGGDLDRVSVQVTPERWAEYAARAELPGVGAAPAEAEPGRWVKMTQPEIAAYESGAQTGRLSADFVETTPLTDLPAPLRDAISQQARLFLKDVMEGEPGQRLFNYERGGGLEVTGISSSYPSWYGEFLKRYSTNRQAVLKALQKIVAGEADQGPMVHRLKRLILDELMSGGHGAPGDPLIMRLMGSPESEVQKALQAYQELGLSRFDDLEAAAYAARQRLRQLALQRIYDEAEAGTVQVGDAVQQAEQTVAAAPGAPVLPDFDRIVGRQLYIGTGLDELWFNEGSRIVREMEEQAVGLLNEPPVRLASLPPETLGRVQQYLDHMVGEFRETRFAAMRIGEATRDASLLNYSRTYNWDNWLGIGMPFHFWYTHSIMNWALATIDRPWIIANYLKTKLFFENVMGENQGFPQRLKGHVKIDAPFAPAEAGDIWVNPFRMIGLPFEQFTQPFERWQQSTVNVEQRTLRKLDEMLKDGSITAAEQRQALTDRKGPIWEWASSVVKEEDESLRFDLMDFMNLSISPHLPISMAWNIARGTPEELAPLPHTRSLKHIATLLGIEPGVYDNVWGNVRKAMGLPAFDQYDNYRTRREVSNMLGEGAVVNGRPVTKDEVLLAMATQSGPLWEEAINRSARVEAFRYASRFFGIPANPYPPGEEHLRSLYDEFFDSMKLRDQGDDRAMGRFFEAHPEFEARLALWKEPEEQLKQFLIDQIWNWWWDAPRLHRDEAIQQLGPLFERGFANEDTRAPEAISTDVLTAWVHLLGGEAPGKLSISPDIVPVQFTDEVTARRLQTFYDARNETFLYSEQVYPLWDHYFKLEEGDARRAYWDKHPILELYVDWRRDFMLRNPDLIPYIEDDPEKQPKFASEAALVAAEQKQPAFRWWEWQAVLGPPTYNLVTDYLHGEDLPLVARNRLDAAAEQYGLADWQEVVERVAESLKAEVPEPPGPSTTLVSGY
jgi:hypothetical protein